MWDSLAVAWLLARAEATMQRAGIRPPGGRKNFSVAGKKNAEFRDTLAPHAPLTLHASNLRMVPVRTVPGRGNLRACESRNLCRLPERPDSGAQRLPHADGGPHDPSQLMLCAPRRAIRLESVGDGFG